MNLLERLKNSFLTWGQARPTNGNLFFLLIFGVIMMWPPFLFHHEIIMMESGIHLPGFFGMEQGLIPYKDFFYLRGPLEFLIPYWMMMLFGFNMIQLPLFYAIFSIGTLSLFTIIASQVFRTRFILFSFVPIIIARTFPRISFYYWGGMRYFFGALTLLFAIQMYRKISTRWAIAVGITTAICFWTTLEAGFVSFVAVLGSGIIAWFLNMMDRSKLFKLMLSFLLTFISGVIFGIIVLAINDALIPYIDSRITIITNMRATFIDNPAHTPQTIQEFLGGFLPNSKFFKLFTPLYGMMAAAGLIFIRRKRGQNWRNLVLMMLLVYSAILFWGASRLIWGHHFEMMLQPYKLLYFFMLEEVYLWVMQRREQKQPLFKPWLIPTTLIIMTIVIFGLSWGHSLKRYHKRFYTFKWIQYSLTGKDTNQITFLRDEIPERLTIDRANGMVVPEWQATEINGVVEFLKENTQPDESILCYPEVGNYHFFAQRPFKTRFPIGTTSWMNEDWFAEYRTDVMTGDFEYVVMTHPEHRTFPTEWYFRNLANKQKHTEITDFILENYELVKSFESVGIYKKK